MKVIKQQYLTGERALFKARDLKIYDTIFDDGESPLKESCGIEIYNSMFKWKYPLWYSYNIKVDSSTWFEMARSGVWYTKNIEVNNCTIEAPKNFRRCFNVTINNTNMPNANETFWSCGNIKLNNVFAKGDYFGMNSVNIRADNFTLCGNYAFDGGKNIEIHNAKMLSKDSFWNCKNVTVYDSFISGEYLGWNSQNLKFINCTIESLQGMCYIDNIQMINCKLINTTLAFEYSSVDADICSKIDSVFNPTSGQIIADEIGELIIEKDKIDPSKTIIKCRNK